MIRSGRAWSLPTTKLSRTHEPARSVDQAGGQKCGNRSHGSCLFLIVAPRVYRGDTKAGRLPSGDGEPAFSLRKPGGWLHSVFGRTALGVGATDARPALSRLEWGRPAFLLCRCQR